MKCYLFYKTMAIISFDVYANKVNFRQIFANSSSMTYLFPPLPTIQGMIGAILGYDDYTETLSKEVCRIGAMQIGGPYRTWTTTYSYSKQFDGRGQVEYLEYENGRVKYFAPDFKFPTIKFEKLLTSGKRKQAISLRVGAETTALVPRTWLVSSKEGGKIGYRIYFSHDEESVVHMLYERVKEKNPFYAVSIGKAQSIARLDNPRYVQTIRSHSETVMTRMVTNWEDIADYYVKENRQRRKKMMHLRLPEVMMVHSNTQERILKRVGSYYAEQAGNPYQISLRYQPLLDVETEEAIVWM